MFMMGYPRKMWGGVEFLGVRKENNYKVVKLGADEPADLLKKEAVDRAKLNMKDKRYKYVGAEDDVALHGQNELATRDFYFIKK